MANSIAVFKKYVDLLDEVYQTASATSCLDGDNKQMRMGANANEIIIPKITLSGLADYDRNGGYVAGDVNLTNETVKMNFDRNREFTVDAMDNEETAGVAFGTLANSFIRTRVIPELDAFRMATYAGANGVNSKTATLASGSDALTALIEAQNTLDEGEVNTDSRILFITPTLYNSIMNVDTTKSKAVLDSFCMIQKIPQSRFWTAIEQLDGKTSGEEDGGFKKATGAAAINFMVVEKSSVLQFQKHTVTKVIPPEENQRYDGYSFFYRSYGIADLYENKRKGVYVHHVAAE